LLSATAQFYKSYNSAGQWTWYKHVDDYVSTRSVGIRPLEPRFNSDTEGYDLNCSSAKQGGPLLSLGNMIKDTQK